VASKRSGSSVLQMLKKEGLLNSTEGSSVKSAVVPESGEKLEKEERKSLVSSQPPEGDQPAEKKVTATIGSGSTDISDPYNNKEPKQFDFSSKLDVIDEMLHVEDANENELESNRDMVGSMRAKNPAQLDSPPAQNSQNRKPSQNSQSSAEFQMTEP